MTGKQVNLSLLGALAVGAASGLGIFLAGAPALRPVLWLHAVAGFTVLLLFVWKRHIIVRSLDRQGITLHTLPALALLALVLAALLTGVAWSSTGLPPFGPYSGLTVHAALGALPLALLALHGHAHWPRMRRTDLVGRRTLLQSGLLLVGGAAAWRATEGATVALGLDGARRRFTGSRLVRRFSGNDFPASNWLTDNPDPLDLSSWRLRIIGHADAPFALAFDDFTQGTVTTAVLDCTGGWYTEQAWTGVSLADLLDRAKVRSGARSVVVRAATGYWRRFTLKEARRALLATHVGGVPLAHEHGAPLRLVIPGKRGYEWVKWVTTIEVSTASPLLKWPLPIS